MARRRVAVLVSGRGSNLGALIEASRDADYPAEIVYVASDREAGGVALAAKAGLVAEALPFSDYEDRGAFEAALQERLELHEVDLVCLAGFMRLLSGKFVDVWRDRLLNIHPSLLPSFRGLDTHARALAAGVKLHGCTVHFVRPEMDEGPIIAQGAVPVLKDDTEAKLAARVLAVEHRLYPRALAIVAAGQARVSGERVSYEPAIDAAGASLSWPPDTSSTAT